MPRWRGRRLRGGICTVKTCICPNCGESKEVGPGIPCRTVRCPKCGTPMMRSV